MTATPLASSLRSARDTFELGGRRIGMYRLSALREAGIAPNLERLPFSIKILLEAVLRNCDGVSVREEDVTRLANWRAPSPEQVELPFKPARVILQDFTGVPVLVDLAAMRAAVARMGGDANRINPLVPVDLVIDHSVQVDAFGSPAALSINTKLEFHRNRERYEFLRWGQANVKHFRVVPPATGIVHQVNLEYLAKGVVLGTDAHGDVAYPDTLVGTDSHTTMINGLGVVGWGVGGIEAEASMLGQPMFMVTPEVVGVRLKGALKEGVTATDLTLTVTQLLRRRGVVEKFVEFFGPGLSNIAVADRATIANMAPEYGATMGFFPVDAGTVDYLRRTGRAAQARLVEAYAREQGIFRTDDTPDPVFTDILELDLGTIEPCLAGPKRPQDRVLLSDMKSSFAACLSAPVIDRGFGLDAKAISASTTVELGGESHALTHGAVVIAAITSCTNTSNPSVMLAAGLLAKKAVAKGLTVKPWVKTSLAPGSKVVMEYLRHAGLISALEALKFHLVGYGCTTCIGNSGPLPEEVARAIVDGKLVASAVLSGNRNFEGRVNPLVKANYLASPPLVVAYAIAGTTTIDFATEPLGRSADGKPIFLRDVWPSQREIAEAIDASVTPAMFDESYADVFAGSAEWNAIASAGEAAYAWNEASTYIQEPPFFLGFSRERPEVTPIRGARILALLGDSVTTDAISPAGDIASGTPAAKYLEAQGVARADFNSYGSRRGNDRVMVRGTFANIRLKNFLVPGVEGGVTIHSPSGDQMAIFDAAERYKAEGVPLIVVAGKEYGTGSSRDWAAKGTLLLGVRAVLAESYERIHRANLVGMGVLPLQFLEGQDAKSLGITGAESFELEGVDESISAKRKIVVAMAKDDGRVVRFEALARLDTPVEVLYYKNGGILHTVLRGLMQA